jgi:hypothetical protein
MIPLPAGVRVWLATGYTDMRNYAELLSRVICDEPGYPTT